MAAPKKQPKTKPGDLNGSLQVLLAEVISLRERVARAEQLALRRKSREGLSAEAGPTRRPKVGS
jgi:hypothetical protein